MSTIQGSGDFISTCASVGEGWRRIVNINISAGDDCPGEWRKATQSGVSFCRLASDDKYTCSSANFFTNGISYQRVCGRARGYQYGNNVAFHGSRLNPPFNRTIDESYASGLSVTYGTNPRQHIWTFVSGRGVKDSSLYSCPCSTSNALPPLCFVGNNYYCESASWYKVNGIYFSTTLYGMEQDLQIIAAMIPLNPGSIVS